MAVKRMDNVGIVVEDLAGAVPALRAGSKQAGRESRRSRCASWAAVSADGRSQPTSPPPPLLRSRNRQRHPGVHATSSTARGRRRPLAPRGSHRPRPDSRARQEQTPGPGAVPTGGGRTGIDQQQSSPQQSSPSQHEMTSAIAPPFIEERRSGRVGARLTIVNENLAGSSIPLLRARR